MPWLTLVSGQFIYLVIITLLRQLDDALLLALWEPLTAAAVAVRTMAAGTS